MRKEVLRSNQGQAVFEYILVLTVIVAIVLGLVFQFNDAFRTYARNYFGEYLSCLLRAGELPNLGSPNPNSLCDADFQPFSLANGRQPNGEPGTLGRSSNLNSRDRNNNRDGSSSEGKESGPKEPGGAGDEGGSSSGGRVSRFSQNVRGAGGLQIVRKEAGPNQGEGNDNKNAGNRRGATTRRVIRFNADGTPVTSRDTVAYGRQSVFRASQTEETQFQEAAALGVGPNSDQAQSRPKQIEQTVTERKTAAEEEVQQELGFGNFLRYLIIAAIVISILLFLAGQFLQIQKSMEK